MFQPGSHLYMGETVLSFAASMGHRRIVEYLIETVEVDPNSVDTGGNNVLHVLAYWGYRSDRTTTVDDAEDMEKGGPRGEAVVDLLWEGRERPSDSDRASVDDVSATYSEQDKAQNMTGENSRFSSDLAREKGKNRNDDIPNAPTFPTTTTTSFQDQQPRIERPKSLAGSILPHVHTHASWTPLKQPAVSQPQKKTYSLASTPFSIFR
ncbi:hypothetical protein BC829DRAFT_478566 [Chytridium lagenaria]|nr:hypothetical protein BC829DRAFT_478566 [Chytridium lagenaria]